MNLISLSKAVLASSVALLIGACGGAVSESAPLEESDNVSTEEAMKANVQAGSFNLYDEAHATPSLFCDPHTNLSLRADYYSTATLEERVGGSCEMLPLPNKRAYRLKLSRTDCGTRIYTGSVTKKGKRSEITITDNRARLCRDLVAAKVIVDETRDGVTTTKYSHDGSDASSVWPADATTLVAESTGGFSPRLPAGSTCRVGTAKFSFDIATKSLNWEVCEVIDWNTAFKPRSGTTKLSAATLALVNNAMNQVTPSKATTCGYDLPMRSITVTSASLGAKTYEDSFYACRGDADYVDNIGGVFAAFYTAIGAP
jgi:hypothetical protein